MPKNLGTWAFLSTSLIAAILSGCVGAEPLADEQSTFAEEQGISRTEKATSLEENNGKAAVNMAAGCRCIGTMYTTPSAATSSSNCSDSQNGLYDFLSGFVDCGSQDLCSQNLVITQSCFSPGPGSWQVNGYMRYKCGEWTCGQIP